VLVLVVVLLALLPVLDDTALLVLVLVLELERELELPPEEPEPDDDDEEETRVPVSLISRELAPTLMVNVPAGRIHAWVVVSQ
jgi:di/tricarboxylate transporter